MSVDQPFLVSQLPQIEQVRSSCGDYLRTHAEITGQLRTLEEASGEDRDRIEAEQVAARQKQEQRIGEEYHARIEQVQTLADQHRQMIEVETQQQLKETQGSFEDTRRKFQQTLDNNLWVLQSVCDETQENSPVMRLRRSTEAFESQRSEAAAMIGNLTQRLEFTAKYLAHCHASVAIELPEPSVAAENREDNHRLLNEQCTQAFTAADQIDRLMLPQWVCGMRLVGLSLLIILVLTGPITAIRADVRAFLNPDLSAPDWQWLGVSVLISAGVAILVSAVMILLVQQKLRTRFVSMLQNAANAQNAFARWEIRCQRGLRKLEMTASSWTAQVARRRDQKSGSLTDQFNSRLAELQEWFDSTTAGIRNNHDLRIQSIDQWQTDDRNLMDKWQADALKTARAECQARSQAAFAEHDARSEHQSATLQRHLSNLKHQWKRDLGLVAAFAAASRRMADSATGGISQNSGEWTVPTLLPQSIAVGRLSIELPDVPDTTGGLSSSGGLDVTCAESSAGDSDNSRGNGTLSTAKFDFPALLRFPADTSILVEHDSANRETAIQYVQSLLLQLLTSIPPGRVQFTLIDPVGLGQSFSAMMHLADYDEMLISNRIWTESTQIRERLQKVTEHMENIFQTYLRSEFATIEEYNASAGEVAEPYHFVVVAGFPAAFSEEAARHLTSILTSGPRCGVHTIVTWSPDQIPPRSFQLDDLKNHCLRFKAEHGRVSPMTGQPLRSEFTPLPQLSPADYVAQVRAVGEKSKDARRVEVSFTRIAPKPAEIWTHSTADGVDLPIGRAGATRLQYMRLGRGTSQHVLIAGKTGSGKSTLLHILITNLAMHYSPNEIQFYLIDFKKGVEFRTYAVNQLPHAKVVAIESDREFAMSVLERLDEVLQERGELFRSRGVQDLPAFRERCPKESMPRLLLLVDEFQEFFVAEDRVSSRASLLLDRLVRQGRAFGIHVVLGSQTLGGAYSLARSTLGQVAIRIALQCSENDAHLILGEDNSAARLLSRPGEAIYNDANGLVEGNHPFQIAWLNDARRELAIREMLDRPRSEAGSDNRMVVFEGNVPPSVEHCGPLTAWLRSESDATRHVTDFLPIWVGEPVAIAPPTCIELRRTNGQNVLIVGQDAEMADSVLLMAALSCFHSFPSLGGVTGRNAIPSEPVSRAAPQYILLHDDRDKEAISRFTNALHCPPGQACSLRGLKEADSVIDELHETLIVRESAAGADDSPELLLSIRNIGQFRSLRRDDDELSFGGFGEQKKATTATKLVEIIKRGSAVGIHVLIWSDSYSNATRWLGNSLLREFENRIAFRMNQSDSASLLDTPVAAGLNQGRAILYRDQTGQAEKFRPFAWPSETWLTGVLPGARVAQAAQSPASDELDINSLMIE